MWTCIVIGVDILLYEFSVLCPRSHAVCYEVIWVHFALKMDVNIDVLTDNQIVSY